MDLPNERSSHTIPTPRGGGLAIVVSWFLGITYLFCTNQIDNQLYYAFLSGIILVIISLTDDILDLPPSIRLLGQSVSAALAIYFLNGLQMIDLGFYQINNTILFSCFAFIGFLWIINLYNFLDGIDGYAATEIIFICLAIFALTTDIWLLVLVAAASGFLVLNWQKAKIFMGDVGSTLLGFNIAIMMVYYQNIHRVNLVVVIILFSVFWFDATVTLIRRLRNREKIWQAHRKHAYQRIVQFGFSHQKTVVYSILLNFTLFILAIGAFYYNQYALVFLLFSLVLMSFILKLIDKRKGFEK